MNHLGGEGDAAMGMCWNLYGQNKSRLQSCAAHEGFDNWGGKTDTTGVLSTQWEQGEGGIGLSQAWEGARGETEVARQGEVPKSK